MAAKKTQKKKTTPSIATPGAALVRLVLLGVAVLVIVLVSGFLFARTDGFRGMVESRILSSLGLRLEIESSRALLNGDLIFDNIHTTNRVADGVGGVQIDHALVRIYWLDVLGGNLSEATRAVQIDGWKVNFAPDPRGVMQPAALAGASDWLGQWGGLALPDGKDVPAQRSTGRTGAPEVPAKPFAGGHLLDRWKETSFRLSRGDIEWWDGRGNVLVSVHDIAFYLTPLQLPTRPAAHYHATVKSAVLPGDQRVRDMDLELLRTGETYLVLNLKAVRQTGGGASR